MTRASAPLCAILLFAAGCAAAAEGPRDIVLREQLNQTYGLELVSYPFEAAEGAAVSDWIQVTGPRGWAPAQLTECQAWPGKSNTVKSARLVLLVDELKPLSSATYVVAFGKGKAPAVATDLKVNVQKDNVEITTAHLGVRLLLGEGKGGPFVALKDVPGPLVAMRLGGGAWAGGSQLSGDAQVTEWSAKLTDNGPVLARVVTTYALANGNTLTLTATVVAGDSAMRWDMAVKDDQPSLGVEFRLPPVPGVKQAVLPIGYGQWSRADRNVPLTAGDQPFTWLGPDTSIAHVFADCAWAVKLAAENGPELRLQSRDPGAWTTPVAPITYGGYKTWNLDMIPLAWDVWKRKRIPVSYAADGTVTMRATLAQGQRKWSVAAGAPRVGERLDRIKDMVLDWPADPKRPSPHLFADRAEIEDVWKRAAADPELMKLIGGAPNAGAALRVLMRPEAERAKAEVAGAVKALGDQLALLGNFDVMRGAIRTAGMYDATIDSGLLTPQERSLFRAQMAYLGYQMADPQTWSIERGYHSGNPNMSVSYTLSLGVIACALSDHPKAKAWAFYATEWMDRWLTDEVGPNGQWLPEGSHYGIVSLEPMISYAITAQRAGFHDFTNDQRLKDFILYYAKTHTPRDVQRGNFRVSGAWGRGTSGDRLGMFGIAARMTAKTDPAFSKVMQWMWAEGGYPVYIADSRLAGFEPYYEDRRLPMEAPAWGTDWFPNLGAFMRSAYATPQESYVILLAATDSLRNLDVWTPGIGSISQWFARGKPLSTCFNTDTGYKVRHELLREGVRLARNWGEPADPKMPFGHYTQTKVEAFASLPRADYSRSTFVNTKVDDRDWFPDKVPAYPRVTPAKEPKLEWTRQVLFLKDADPAGPAYLVLRDTTRGGQPTAWQFWTLSEKIGTPDQVRDANAFLADKPGQAILPARELPAGNRYTALGQFGMDLEYFIVSPAGTPRHTLRYGGPDNGRVPEYEDLLHLQQPGDGTYYVALYPRPRDEAAPAFTALADGKIIKIAGAFGADYALLALDETAAAAEGVAFKGTAAVVQQRVAGTTLSLGAAGEAHWSDFGLSAPVAASLLVTADKLVLTLPPDSPGGEVTITLAGGWKLATGSGTKVDGGRLEYRLKLPKGAAQMVLPKGK